MAQAVEPHVARTPSASFEIERLELSDEARLEVAGRWFGVRGRRFVRPAVTLRVDGESCRLLADIEHKPWAAEDGELWQAASPGAFARAGVGDREPPVAPDITIPLRFSGTGPGRPPARPRDGRPSAAQTASVRRELGAVRQALESERRETER